MRTLIGSEGGCERIILCVSWHGFYLAVKPSRRYYRIGLFFSMMPWAIRPYVGRS